MKLKNFAASLLFISTFCVLSIKGQIKKLNDHLYRYSADISITIKSDGGSEYKSVTGDEYAAYQTCDWFERSKDGLAIFGRQSNSSGQCFEVSITSFPAPFPYSTLYPHSSLSIDSNKVFLKHTEPFLGHGRGYVDYTGQQKLTVTMPVINSYSPKNGILRQVGEEQQVTWIFNAPEDLAIEVEGQLEAKNDCLVTPEELQSIVPSLSLPRAREILEQINETMKKAGADTRARQWAFLSMSATEAGGFTGLVERGSGAYFDRYEPGTKSAVSLGNTTAGDGAKFKGRGWLHMTGRWNYTAATAYLRKNGYDVNLVHDPDLVATNPEINAVVSAWYWRDLKKLNDIADKQNVDKVTAIVNGPEQNGLKDRRSYYERAKASLPQTSECP